MTQLLTAIVLTDTRNQFSCSKLALGLHDCPLPVNPMRLNSIQPWAFGRQLADEYAYSFLSFCFAVVCPNPAPYRLGEVPRGVIPDNQQSFLPFFCQLSQHPVEKLCRKTRYGFATNKPQPDLFAISSQQPITANCLGAWISLISSLLYEPQRFCLSPAVHRRLSKTTPPDFIYIPQNPLRVLFGQPDQAVARLFLRAYSGSGLVIQSRARFQLIPRRFIALRIVSSETSDFVSPRSWQTSATIGKLQVERALPNCRGEWCSKARTCSHLTSSSSGLAVLGRDDFCSRQPKPSVSKARITLRTVWSVQPSWRAIWRGVFPSALRRRIWLLRNVNASAERNPARKQVCSLFVKDRAKRGSFMPSIFSQIPCIQIAQLVLH
jgi:hypothetical protein